MLIPEKRLEQALTYISEHTEEIGRAKGFLEGLLKQEKIIFGQEFLGTTGTKDERTGIVHTSLPYKDWKVEYENATTDYHIVKAKMDYEYLIVEVFRTESANLRRGNV